MSGFPPSLLDDPPQLSGWALKGNRIPGTTPTGKPGDSGQGLAAGSLIMSIGGSMAQALGAYYATLGQKSELKSRASALEFDKSIAAINARAAEREAQSLLEQGKHQVAQLTMQAGQQQGAQRVAQAASGVEMGTGSAAEAVASSRLVEEIDILTINRNATRAASAARMQRTNYENESLLAGVSAKNMRRTAKSIQPGSAVATSLLQSSGQVASQWYAYSQRF